MGWQTDYQRGGGKSGQSGINCWDWFFSVVFNSSELQLTWHIGCAEIEIYWLIFENIIILPMTSPPEWGYGVKRGDKFSKKLNHPTCCGFTGERWPRQKS